LLRELQRVFKEIFGGAFGYNQINESMMMEMRQKCEGWTRQRGERRED